MNDQAVTDQCADSCGWVANAGEYREFAALKGAQRADWVVIGGGFTGLAAARRIAQMAPAARVVLVDGKRIGQGASGRNSGFVVAHSTPDAGHFANARARADYNALNALNRDGVSALKGLVTAQGIECQWEDTGTTYAVAGQQHFDRITQYAAGYDEIGVKTRVLEAADLAARLGTAFYGHGLEVRGGALVQPAMLAKGLAECLPPSVEVFENTRVLGVDVEDGMGVVRCVGAVVRAPRVVVAVNGFLERLGLLPRRVFPLALTASLTRVLNAREQAQMADVESWGVLSPLSFGATLRWTKDRRIMIRNTAEYAPSGIGVDVLKRRRTVHLTGLSRRFPWLGKDAIEHTWSGNLGISRNSKPVFEAIDNTIFIAGCYNASGVARGTSMGRFIVDMALREPSDLLDRLRAITPATRIPPRPFFDVGVRARLAMERWQGRGEG
ncbi:MAG: FAD-binding oxidoreductase [Rhodobacterales bacterium]|nr:FAD-binding oxidoreductase [Rhodobacterales bacterium]